LNYAVSPRIQRKFKFVPNFNVIKQWRRALGHLSGAAVTSAATASTLLAYPELTVVSVMQRRLTDFTQFSQAEPQPAQSQSTPQPVPSSTPPGQTKGESEKEGTPATVVDAQQLESILGKNVISPTGEDMGRIVDIIVDRSGQVRAAIIDFGGFLGVGTRKIAVDWRLIRFPSDGKMDNVMVDLTSNQLRVSPVFKAGEPVVVIGRPNDSSQ
jgi:sporulation protein YlmC with PRC-barrel domain